MHTHTDSGATECGGAVTRNVGGHTVFPPVRLCITSPEAAAGERDATNVSHMTMRIDRL